MMQKITMMLLLLFSMRASAQQRLTIEQCYQLARDNYPLVRQLELVEKSTEYTVQNAAKAYLPQVTAIGQATYQSAVTELPIKLPGMSVPSLSKDQYKLYGDVSQLVYDGGTTRLQKNAQQVAGEIEKQKIEVELYKLKDRINQLYFGVLLIGEQLKQQAIVKQDIQLGINKAEALVANGTALKSTVSVLKAELLKADQRSIELKASRKAYIDMLALFTKQTLDETTVLETPQQVVYTSTIHRPELKLYEYQREQLTVQNKMTAAKNIPKLNLFLQAGAGRPALNFLSNELEGYYIGGVRLSWSLSGLYTAKNERRIIDVNNSSIRLQEETFLLNTKIVLQQQSAEVNKLQELLATDNDIIDLRTSVKTASAAQLENGVITTSDYLRELNAEDQARQARILHTTQLLMAQYNQQTTTGN